MRIFLISYIHDEFIRDDMGGFRKVYELAQNLEEFGHQVFLFVLKSEYHTMGKHTIPVPAANFPVIRPITFNFFLFFYLLYYFFKIRPTLIYSRPFNSFIPLFVSKLTSTYFIHEVNGDQYAHLRMMGTNQIKLAVIKFIERVNTSYADKIVPITEGLKRILHARYGIPDSKMHVIESGTNINLFTPMDSKDCRQGLNLDPSFRYVGFVGTLFKYQGIDTLIDCSHQVISNVPEARFLIVGDGEMKIEWIERVEKLGLKDFFKFPGQVPYAEVPLFINAMTVCTAPFKANRGETSPLKIFDYFACGKPVVSSDIPSIHRLLLDSQAAILVPSDDPVSLAEALSDILRDEAERNRLGENGRKFVTSKYSWKGHVESLLSVIETDI